MKPITKMDDLFRGALVLTVAALLTKILSAFYRIPFQNIVGDVGFYIYQQVYPFYAMMLVLATTGFPVVISKLYSDELKAGDKGKAERTLYISLAALGCAGVLFFLCFFLGAGRLAALMGDPQLVPLFKVLAFPFLLLPVTAVFRGYFQGLGNMVPTACSQVGEQLFRVGTILLLSFLFVKGGYSLYTAGSGAVFGSVTGGLAGLWILAYFFLRDADQARPYRIQWGALASEAPVVLKKLAGQGFAFSISGMVLILMQLADSLQLYGLLLEKMEPIEAKTAKGVFDRGQPLLQLGTVAATALALSIVPAISGEKQKKLVAEKARFALELSLIIGIAASIGLACIIEPANRMLYMNEAGSEVLATLGLTIFPATLLITTIGILQGLNRFIFPALLVMGGFAMKLMLNAWLVPGMGTMGAAAATFLAVLAMAAVLSLKLRTVTGGSVLHSGTVLKVLLCATTMGIAVRAYLLATEYLPLDFLPDRLMAGFQALSAVLLGAVVYLLFMIKTNVLGKEELQMLPFGSRLMGLLPDRTGDVKK